MIVKLTEIEQTLCKLMGKARVENYSRRGLKHNHKIQGEDLVQGNILGFAAELATCKYFNVYPDLDGSPTYSPPWDLILLGSHLTIDVKFNKDFHKYLAVFESKVQDPADIYLMVKGDLQTMVLKGYATSEELICDINKADLGEGSSYIMPEGKLSPVDELIWQ